MPYDAAKAFLKFPQSHYDHQVQAPLKRPLQCALGNHSIYVQMKDKGNADAWM
jgi:hypothetical protein